MAYNEFLADRVRQFLKEKNVDLDKDLEYWIDLTLDYNAHLSKGK